ncbi:putative Heterokaryon incompatibility protein-domain-containing protein [Seiridium cardinale]
MCLETHSGCGLTQGRNWNGFSAIDVRKRVVVPLPDDARYASLSYMWGTPSGETIEHSGLPKNMPRTVDDSIIVAKSLGFKYLWVDRYCISQLDGDAKRVQISRMAELYSRSTLTIIAVAGEGSNYGLPGVSIPRKSQISVRVGRQCLIAYDYSREEISRTKWATRGWTYQEALLSSRRLVFTENHVYFQCGAMLASDDFRDPLENPGPVKSQRGEFNILELAFPKRLDQVQYEQAGELINEFQKRDLSYASDGINAISGILRIYEGRVLAGLPIPSNNGLDSLGCLSLALAWTTDSYLWPANSKMIRRSIFPSWTWAGWQRPGGFSATNIYFELLSVQNDEGEAVRADSSLIGKHYRCLIPHVVAHFADGLAMEWQSKEDLIVTRSNNGGYPKHLELSGWTFHLCQLIGLPNLAHEGSPISLLVQDLIEGRLPQDDTIALVLGFGNILSFVSVQRSVILLILRRQGPYFERLDMGLLDMNVESSFPESGEPSMPGLNLEFSTILLT